MFTTEDVLKALRGHIGERNGARAIDLVREITGQYGADPHGERVLRQRVEALRLAGHHICAHPVTGYYIAESDEELVATCDYLYERALTSLKQIAAMRRVALPDLRGQLRLPT